MPRLTTVLRRGRKALEDLQLLKVVQSEIVHEISVPRSQLQKDTIDHPEDFVMEWDAPQSQDVLLRRKSESGEEVAVSALLGPDISETESVFPRQVLMKVSLKKPSLTSILQFDCGVFAKSVQGSEFVIQGAHYFQSPLQTGPSVYTGPLFSTLDPALQDELKKYLVEKGISTELTDFLILHLHNKEQNQYVSWLRKLEGILSSGTTSSST